jgi:hypothetical protein
MRRRRFPAASAGQRRDADLFFADLMGRQSVPPAGASQARLQAERFLADLLGEPAHPLSGVAQESPEGPSPVQLAEFGPIGPFGPFGPLRVAIAQRVQKVTAFFEQLKKDFQAAGITFSGVDLLDMQQHAQVAKLKIFNAGTNSATEIYVNIDDGFSKLAAELGGDKRMAELIYATVLVRHELHHVQQFKDKKGPPKFYRDMCVFETAAYADDAKWMKANRATLKKLGMSDDVIDGVISSQEEASKKFEGFAKLSSEPAIKKALISASFLPEHDKLAELYRAK